MKYSRAFLSFSLAVFAMTALPAMANEDLAKSRQCIGCHAIDSKKLVGPGFAAIAAKYKGRKDATAYLVEKIQQGSKGVWGPVPMPATKISDDDAKALATWIQSL